ncbi:MAG: 50S ribosomal protein L19 [Chloroflexi bacterium]|nr:MAG: 50S ribosomal protein L19 [Chloroflexota bacterium]
MADKQVVTKPAGRALLAAVESAQLRKDVPELRSGDTVRLQVKVVEGSRERLQPFEGVVMRIRGGGVNRSIEKIEVLRHARVRRKQLYYLRGLTGKAARLKEVRPLSAKQLAAKATAAANAAAAKTAAANVATEASGNE